MAEKYAPQRRYKAANVVKLTIDINRKTEPEIIEKLDDVAAQGGTKSGYIKSLIRADIERGAK